MAASDCAKPSLAVRKTQIAAAAVPENLSHAIVVTHRGSDDRGADDLAAILAGHDDHRDAAIENAAGDGPKKANDHIPFRHWSNLRSRYPFPNDFRTANARRQSFATKCRHACSNFSGKLFLICVASSRVLTSAFHPNCRSRPVPATDDDRFRMSRGRQQRVLKRLQNA